MYKPPHLTSFPNRFDPFTTFAQYSMTIEFNPEYCPEEDPEVVIVTEGIKIEVCNGEVGFPAGETFFIVTCLETGSTQFKAIITQSNIASPNHPDCEATMDEGWDLWLHFDPKPPEQPFYCTATSMVIPLDDYTDDCHDSDE